MSNKLRRIFNPTREEQLEDLERMRIAHEELLQKNRPKLIPDEDSNILLISSPFETFLGDCENCLHYVDFNCGFATGGNCNKHDWISCGGGYTCKDWEEVISFEKWYKRVLKE